MNWKRIAMLGVTSATLVTLLARASTSVAPPSLSLPAGRQPDLTSPIFPDVERLRERLRAPIVPVAPTRNLFAFRRDVRRVAIAIAAPPSPASAAPVPVDSPAVRAPAFTLVGLAEDAGPDGPVRTAILSGGPGLHFARAGDVLGDYRVSAIGADAIELIAIDDGASFFLSLK